MLEERLQEYYRSISRERFHEREIVWGKDERKIETLLLSPKVQGAPARFLRCQYQAATGAGKTKSMLEMIRIHMESRTRANKKIQPLYCVVEPTLNLVQQTYQASLQLDGLDCFCVCSDGSVPSKSKQEAASQAKYRSRPMLIITTKHSAAGFRQNDGADGSGLLDLFSQQSIIIDMLLLDECHLLAGESEGKSRRKLTSGIVIRLCLKYPSQPHQEHCLDQMNTVTDFHLRPTKEMIFFIVKFSRRCIWARHV